MWQGPRLAHEYVSEQRRGPGEEEAKVEWCSYKPRNSEECQQREGTRQDPPYSLQREHGLADTLISSLRPPERKRIHFLCLQLPSLW